MAGCGITSLATSATSRCSSPGNAQSPPGGRHHAPGGLFTVDLQAPSLRATGVRGEQLGEAVEQRLTRRRHRCDGCAGIPVETVPAARVGERPAVLDQRPPLGRGPAA